jgi:archaellum biogenesis ATPase FlaH
MSFDEIIQHFPGRRVKIKDGFNVICPAHDDRNPSLSITNGGDKVLVKCHAGCATEDVLKTKGLLLKDLYRDNGQSPQQTISETYDYTDEDGNLLFQAVRFIPKGFRQRRPDGNGGWVWNLNGVRRVPYRLPELIKWVESNQPVYICEGEKDADALNKYGGLFATTNPMGAGSWRSEYNEYFRGADVVIVPHRDQPGWDHGQTIARSLKDIANSVRLVELPYSMAKKDGKDVADYINEYSIHEFADLVDETPIWESAPSWFKPSNPLIEPVPNLEWIIEGHAARGSITVLGGSAGSGKSILEQVLLSRRDDRLLPTKPGMAIYLSGADSSEYELRRRARLIGINKGMRTVAIPEDQYCVATNEIFMGELLNQIVKLNADAVVFDTLADFHDGNLYESELANATMRQFANLARKGNVAVILITHTRKGSKEKPNYSVEDIADSRVFGTKADFVFALRSEYQNDGSNLIELQCVKSRSAKPLKPLRAEIFMDDIITNELTIKLSHRLFKNEIDEQSKEDKRKYLITEVHRLKGEGKSYRTIAENLNISIGSASNYAKQSPI